MKQEDKKIVLITGASSGIGKATAELLTEQGYYVYGTSRNAKKNIDTTEDTQTMQLIYMDVTNGTSIEHTVDQIIEKHGKIDVLVNNAGMGLSGSVEATPISEWKRQFDVNFFGTVRVIQTVLPGMRRHGCGTIINIGSVAGFIPIPYQSMYSSTKYAMESLSRCLRMEVAGFGIHVCLINPGDTNTGFTTNRRKVGREEIENHYQPSADKALRVMESDEKNGDSPLKTAQCIARVMHMKRPPISVTVGMNYKWMRIATKWFPDRLLNRIVRYKYIG